MRGHLVLVIVIVGFLFIPGGRFSISQTTPQTTLPRIHVEGTILDAVTGKPLEDASISLFPNPSAKSNEAGRFSVDLLPGATELSISKYGYAKGKLDGRILSSNIPGNNFSKLVAGQNWNDLVIRLYPSATVTGKVFDAQGRPMQDAEVQGFIYLYSPAGIRYRVNLSGGAVRTNDLGIFRYESLDPGDYYFEIRPSSPDLGGGSLLATVFYPNATEVARAEAVHVDPGAVVELKNITPPVVHGGNLRLRFVNNTGEEARNVGSLFVARSGETSVTVKSDLIPKDSLYEVQDLGRFAPGRYFVFGGFATPSGLAEARMYFDLAENDIQADLSVNEYKPIKVTGRAITESSAGDPVPVAGVKLMFHELGATSNTLRESTSVSGSPLVPAIVSQIDGTFSTPARPLMPQMTPYTYRVRPADLPPGMYVKEIRGIDGDLFHLEAGHDLNLTVVVGNDAGVLEGVVNDTEEIRIPLAVVALIPDEPNSNLCISTETTNSTGAFKLQAGPGNYHLYAWHELIGAPYLDPDYMKKIADKGTAVRILANGHSMMNVTVMENP